MKKILVAVVSVVVFAAVALGIVTLLKPKEIVLAEILPQDTAFYYSIQNTESVWKDIKSSRFWRELSELKLWQDIQIQSGLDDLKSQFKENVGVELTEENLMKLIGRELAITITPPASAGAPPRIILLCRGKTKHSLNDITNPIISRIKEKDPQRVEETQYEGNTITNIKPLSADQPQIYFLPLKNILVVGIGDTKTGIQNIADISGNKTKESLSDTDKYKRISGLIGDKKKDLAGLFYMDFIKMRKYLETLAPQGQIAGKTGMETLDFLGGFTEIKDGLITKLYIYPNAEELSPQMKAMWETPPQESNTLKFAPEKTMLYIASSSLDLGNLWNLWLENLKKQVPEQAQPILDNIEKFKTEWNIDFEKDIFSVTGNEMAFIFSDISTEGLAPIPKLGLALKVKDKEKAEKLIADLIAKNNQKAAEEAAALEEKAKEETVPAPLKEGEESAATETPKVKARVRFQINLVEETYDGNTIKIIQLPIVGTGLAPGYTYLDDFLLIGATTKTLHEMIDVTKGKIKPLTHNPSYQDIAGILPKKNNQGTYINMERLMEIGIGICNWIVSFQQLTMPQGEPPADPAEAAAYNEQKAQSEATITTINNNVIPLLKTLKAIKVIASTGVNKPDHVEQTIVLRVKDI